MKFNLFIQYPESRRKKKIECTIAYEEGQGKTAHAFDGDNLVSILHRPELIYIGPVGLMFRGQEPDGCDSRGRQKYKYQEWYCVGQNEATDAKV